MGKAKFPLGMVVATPGALAILQENGADINSYIARHRQGDWGIATEDTKRQNEEGLEHRDQLFSVYSLTNDNANIIWIITEYDRSATTVLLPEDW